MQTTEDLKRKIGSTEALQSVVKTMKALAAVKIRQYEKAVEALEDYNKTVEMGFQIVLRNRSENVLAKRAPKKKLGAVVFGSDQGMCGQLNDQVVSHTLDAMDDMHIKFGDRTILTVGERARAILEEEGQSVEGNLSTPGSVSGITPKVQDILGTIENWSMEKGVDQVYLFYNKHLSRALYRPHTVRLLPMDRQWLEGLRKKPWSTRMLPIFTMDRKQLFSALIRHYLFVSLFRAFAESLASENASRLTSMQEAERNIGEQLAELNALFHQLRQMSITEELLDIVSGFEAIKETR